MGQKIKSENKRNKKLKIAIKILIIILVIAIVAFAIYLILYDKPASADELPDWEAAEQRTREYLSDKIIPQHIYDFTKEYTGELDRNILYEHLYTLSKYLPDLCEDLKRNDAKSYYAKNKQEIKKYLEIENEEDFIKFSEFCEQNDVSGLNIEYCAFKRKIYKCINGF